MIRSAFASGGFGITVDETALKNQENQRVKIYMFVVLWSVAGLAAFRFLGAMWFLIVRMVSLLLLHLNSSKSSW